MNADNIFLERYWNVINTPLMDDGGEVMCIIHTADEITDLVKAERLEKERSALAGANDYLQELINIFNAPLQVLEPICKYP